jgi:prepilin-type N-terminal cleavage/methylation domain-containing protein
MVRQAPNNNTAPPAMTLIEVLVVMGIISVLVALLLPSLSRAKANAVRTVCISNQKQLALALTLYAEHDSNGEFPATNLAGTATSPLWSTNSVTFSYQFFLKPYIGSEPRLFECPADQFIFLCCKDGEEYDFNANSTKWSGTSYGFNGYNLPPNTPPPFSGLAGLSAQEIPLPERTVLTFETPVMHWFSWHEASGRVRRQPDASSMNVMSFVDGHAVYLKTLAPKYTGVGTNPSVITNGLLSEPPPEYGYQWRAN